MSVPCATLGTMTMTPASAEKSIEVMLDELLFYLDKILGPAARLYEHAPAAAARLAAALTDPNASPRDRTTASVELSGLVAACELLPRDWQAAPLRRLRDLVDAAAPRFPAAITSCPAPTLVLEEEPHLRLVTG